jgi:hypothetical protein
MKWTRPLPLALVFALAPGFAAANAQSEATSAQGPQEALETSHAVLPIDIAPAVEAQAKASEQPQMAPQDQFRNCHRLVAQVRDHARTIAKSAGGHVFNGDRTAREHKQMQETLSNLKQEHDRLYQSLSQEQQSSVQMRNATLLQSHDRLQNLVKEMEAELNGSVLHVQDIVDQAKATDRETKAFQKEFRAMGKDLGFLID